MMQRAWSKSERCNRMQLQHLEREEGRLAGKAVWKQWKRCGKRTGKNEEATPMGFSPSVYHLVAFLQPAQAWHPPAGCCSIQVHNHIVLSYQQLQATDHVSVGW